MRIALTVLRKELVDALRDRRSILTSIILPLLLFPLIFGGLALTQRGMEARQSARDLKVGFVDTPGVPLDFVRQMEANERVQVTRGLRISDIQPRLDSEALDGVFLFSKDFEDAVAGLKETGYVNLYYKDRLEPVVQRRLRDLIRDYRDEKREARHEALGVTERQLRVVVTGERDLSTPRETLAAALGGIVAYIFIMVGVTSCMFMAMDLGVGEKERGTLETLLTTSASRLQILAGKLSAISVVGFLAACLSLSGLWFSVVFIGEEAGQLIDVVLEILEPWTILLLMSLLLPVVVLFAALELSLSIYANNVKEAQSLVSPLIFAVIGPALVGALPGFELGLWSSLLPIFNIALATKAILAGSADGLHLALVFASTLLMAAAAVAWTTWWFQREKTLFRA